MLSLLPPVAAIVLAIVTRRAALSLFLGVAVGALVLAHGNPLTAVPQLLETHLWAAGTDDGRLRVFAFTLLMGAMVGVLGRNGGMQGLVEAVTPLARNRRRGQLVGWILGMVVFFDDYANTILLGTTLRPLFDRLKLSREKLSYIVDSTSAPVAGLALISTWVAVEIENIRLGLEEVDAIPKSETAKAAFDLFLYSIPYRFYMLWALVMVPLVALLARDFPSMQRAESRALGRAPKAPEEAAPAPETERENTPHAHWLFAVTPIVVCVSAIVWLLVHTGMLTIAAKNAELIAAGEPAISLTLQNILGNADSYVALLWGSLVGLLAAMSLSRLGGLLSGKQAVDAALRGAALMLPALVILWLAASLSTMTGGQPKKIDPTEAKAPDAWKKIYPEHETKLYTGALLSDQVKSVMAPPQDENEELQRPRLLWLLPTVVFVLASIVSFATGTSWGTMGILMPMAVPLAHGLLGVDGAEVSLRDPLLLCTIGSVLAGAIFGDHCSPISDTTILSSQASGCDHIAHVWTQLPYALLVGAIAILCGTLPIGWGANVWVLLPLGAAAMVAALLLLGRRVQ